MDLRENHGHIALSLFTKVALFSPFWQSLVAPDFCVPTYLNLFLSVAHTDSSDNSDLEDDIILSLNE